MNIKDLQTIPKIEVENKTRSIVVAAQSLAIFDDESYRQATAQLIGIKQVRQMIHEIHDPAVEAAWKAHKEACKAKKTVEAPLIEAETIIKHKMSLYHLQSEQTREEQEETSPMLLPAAVPKVEGISYRETYHAEVTDLKALIKAVAEGRVPIMVLQVNMTFLNNQARTLKSLLNYPGVSVKSSVIVAAKAE